ncbi:MAG: HEPN domain-containing protein [Clostridia bacterium]|nr:HEPN domain-containing protein [Clostridia bacterium]
MEGSIKELSVYRFSKAREDAKAAEIMLIEAIFKASINRSYYAIFHAMRAVTILKGFDSSKHSGIIAYFNKEFIKTGEFDKIYSKIVKAASLLREKSDYEDFYVASKQDAIIQLDNAKQFVIIVEEYLKRKGILN